MKYSIVVISKDRHSLMLEVLQKLKKIEAKPQIIAVEATDKPHHLEIEGVEYLPIPTSEAGFSNQRNIGVQHANGEYIIFVDDDVEIQPGWYENLTKVTDEDGEISGVMGSVFPLNPTIVGFCEGMLGHPGGGFKLHNRANGKLLPLDQVATCNTIMKKQAILEAGSFDLANKYGSEDSDLTTRINSKYGPNPFRYAPEALVYHMPRNKFSKIIPWYIRRGKADADLFFKHTTHLKYLIRTSILLKIIPCILLSLFFNNFFILLSFFAVWYIIQLMRKRFIFKYFEYYDFPRIKQLATFFIFPFIKLTADLMFDLGRIMRFLIRK